MRFEKLLTRSRVGKTPGTMTPARPPQDTVTIHCIEKRFLHRAEKELSP